MPSELRGLDADEACHCGDRATVLCRRCLANDDPLFGEQQRRAPLCGDVSCRRSHYRAWHKRDDFEGACDAIRQERKEERE